eukprot:scaffold7787_cov68-Skeletonema_marinoi.AAC.1
MQFGATERNSSRSRATSCLEMEYQWKANLAGVSCIDRLRTCCCWDSRETIPARLNMRSCNAITHTNTMNLYSVIESSRALKLSMASLTRRLEARNMDDFLGCLLLLCMSRSCAVSVTSSSTVVTSPPKQAQAA